MRARDLFGVAVRVIGLWFLTQAAYWAYWGILKSNGSGLGNPNVPAREDAASASLYVLLGVLLVLLADPITWVFYGLPVKSTISNKDSPSDSKGGA